MSTGLALAVLTPAWAQEPANPTNPTAPAAPSNPAAPATVNPIPPNIPNPPDSPGPGAQISPTPSLPPIAGGVTPTPGANQPEPPPASPAPTGKIAAINIVHRGTANITNQAILSVLSQKIGDAYDQDVAEKDQTAIKSMGYFNGEIGLDATPDPAGGVDVAYTVVENPVVKTIKFSANTKDGQPNVPAATLKGLMDTKEGQVLNTNTLVRDLDRLFNRQNGYMRSKGFIADVSTDINIDPTDGVLTIPLVEAHIDAIRIQGNKRTKTVVVTREMYSRPGDVLDENKLQKDMTRVYNTGLFDQVGPYQLEPTDVGRVNIIVPVVEKRSGTVSVGIGYSSRSQLVGRAELAENNFRGLGEHVSLQYEVGGISSQSSVELGFYEPYLDKNHTSLDVDLYNKVIYRFDTSTFGGGTGNTSTYTETHKGGTLGVNRPLSDTLVGSITGRYETVTTNNFAVALTDAFIRQDGTVAVAGLRAVNNTRDNNISPAGGGLDSVSYEAGIANTSTVNNAPTPLAPGRHNIGKVGVDLRRYISLQGPRKAGDFKSPKKVFAVRLLLGYENTDVPFFEQYFLGGADSLRSSQTDRYWGNKLGLVQTELRLPIGKSDSIQGVLFFDAGDAWGSIYQGQGLLQHQNFSLTTDGGVGIRLDTPVGPIRLDEAIGRDGTRTQFSIGQSF